MLTRVACWDTRAFHDFLEERKVSPFAWGVNDCALFAADGIRAITGTDIAEDFRGKYAGERAAFALIRKVTGGSNVADAAVHCAQKHGLSELANVKFAQRGDLVVFENAQGELVAGLVHLSGVHIVAVGNDGLYRMPISAAQRAWRV
jgi:hypothetical protein